MATYSDILKFHGSDAWREVVSDVKVNAPEFTGVDQFGTTCAVASSTIEGDVVQGTVEIERGSVGSYFRDVNAGFAPTVGKYKNAMFKTANAGGFLEVDRALIDRDPARGALYKDAETKRVIREAVGVCGKQFFYGSVGKVGANKVGATSGFQGLMDYVDSTMVLNCGGTGNSLASIWGVKFNESNGASWLFGRGGEFAIDDWREEIKRSSNGDLTPTYIAQLSFYPGLQVYSKFAAFRIKNIDVSTTVNPTYLIDDKILEALALVKDGKPDAIFMPTAVGRWINGNRANQANGRIIFSTEMSYPKEFQGIPILYTDSLLVGETN